MTFVNSIMKLQILRKEDVVMNRTTFGVMCILFNAIGVPCFMQGNTTLGVKRIFANILIVPFYINLIKGIILGINVLKMTDEEFEAQKNTTPAGWPN